MSARTPSHIGAKPSAARIITAALTVSENAIFAFAVITVDLAILNAWVRGFRFPELSTASAEAIAASLHKPIAKPQSTAASTGASFIPSPTKQTPELFSLSS